MTTIFIHTAVKLNRHYGSINRCIQCNKVFGDSDKYFLVVDGHYYRATWCEVGDSFFEFTRVNNVLVEGSELYLLCNSKLSVEDARSIAEVMMS